MGKPKSPLKIAVDLTPVITNGENGGSKVLVMTLFQRLQTLQEYEFILLTAPWNQAELVQYEAENTTCLVMEHLLGASPVVPTEPSNADLPWTKRIVRRTRQSIERLPGGSRVTRLAKKAVLKVKNKLKPTKTLLQQHQIDLLFCPFSAPNYAEPGIPTVAIVYDLQHLDYPEFFTTEQRQHRDDFLENLLKVADHLVCISEFSRQSFIHKLNAAPSKLSVIHISVYDRWPGIDDDTVAAHLETLGLKRGGYTFYPANYWPHKNHRTLLQAYQIYQQRCPEQALDLVFTGALQQEEDKLRQMVDEMGLGDRVHFLGYLSEEMLEAVWKGCQFLTFPSRYEGFGIPILEAMDFGKPILASTAGSLPEVGGDAVIYFDPNDPLEMANGLVKLTQDEPLRQQLSAAGCERIKHFDPQEMVLQYRQVFADVISQYHQ
jgi:glycosyltransferase involved in cell wall biosynthesis